jgi:hypothetical protein
LSGQDAQYLRTSLDEWKRGVRATEPSQQMPTIAKRLSDADIAALANYFAAQPAPTLARTQQRPSGAAGAAGAAQTAPNAAPTAPSAGKQPSSGTGSEGGLPTTGGAQGSSGSTGGRDSSR